METLDIGELILRAKPFGEKLAALKSRTSPGPFAWYPYQSLSALPLLEEMLAGDSRRLLDLAGDQPILDIGCADGDLAFFFESLGRPVEVVDNPITNFNAMCGVRALKNALRSSVTIHSLDIDTDVMLPSDEYGLVLLLGVLYHLKNPFLVLDSLAKRARYCLLSTAVTAVAPHVDSDIGESPLGFLASERELNGDATVYWIFTDSGLRRLIERANWEICDYKLIQTSDRWKEGPDRRIADQRVFCLLRSKFADQPVNISYGHGWHLPENGPWRWTERQFAVRFESAKKMAASRLKVGLYVPGPVLERFGKITLEAVANGLALAPETLTVAGEHEFVRNLAPLSTALGDIRVDFSLSSAIPPDAGDGRERGIVVTSIGVE